MGCKSSSCHGGAGEKRSQYFTWSQQDFHARAYAVLINARSARMAETLALPAAQTSARCTVCHSPFQSLSSSRLTRTAQGDEGISCESCHGAAGSWLRGHTRRDWTYATRVGAGMHDLRNFYVRANTCVACHQNLDSDLLQAGHPGLTFELDGQSVAEPKHWRDDPASGPRAWLVGQAVALREMSWVLGKEQSPRAESIANWNGLVWLLAKTTTKQSLLPMINQPSEMTNRDLFVAMQQQADLLARRAAEISWNNNLTGTILHQLAAADVEFGVSSGMSLDLQFRRAQRLVLALDRLSQATSSSKNSALVALVNDLRTGANFQPASFATHLATFRATIPQSSP